MAQWPPNSPLQALLSSPSGRKKWQDRQSRRDAERSPWPSPVRRDIIKEMAEDVVAEEGGEGREGREGEDEEDEETLELQLKALQTKIKLNRLKAKKMALEREDSRNKEGEGEGESRERRTTVRARMPPPPQSVVEVPTSPVRRERESERERDSETDRERERKRNSERDRERKRDGERKMNSEQVSPARRKLGLTSNPQPDNISLKRSREHNSWIHREKSFNQRLADTKERASLRQEQQDRLSALRSTAFFNKPSPTTAAATTANITATTMISPTETLQQKQTQKTSKAYQRAQDMTQNSRDAQSGARTGHASLSDEDEDEDSLNIDHNSSQGYDPFSKIHLKKRHIAHPVVAREMVGKEIYTLPRLLKEVKSPDYDPPDCESDFVVFAVLASKSSPLDHATAHQKSTGHDNPLEPAKNKFMVLKLVDLKWEIDCFLFGTAFTHFWKLTPGTLLAILNPAILPPKGNQHNGRFSLKLGSSEDAVMEIGLSRDLALCSAIKKDGKGCEEWVDRRKTEACEFHLSLMVDKARKHRMEVNTMFRDPDGNTNDRTQSRARKKGSAAGGAAAKGNYTREYGILYSVPKHLGGGGSTASAMDHDDNNSHALHSRSREDASRKRIAAAQRERDLAKSLAELGNGMGAAYLKASTAVTSTTQVERTRLGGGAAAVSAATATAGGGATATTAATTTGENSLPNATTTTTTTARNHLFQKPSARELGLLNNIPSTKRLSPPPERKSHFGLPLSTTNKGPPILGWGGATAAAANKKSTTTTTTNLSAEGKSRKRFLLLQQQQQQQQIPVPTARAKIRNRSPEMESCLRRSTSPVKKRARLQVPEKGVREPGRESWSRDGDSNDDSEGELEIIL